MRLWQVSSVLPVLAAVSAGCGPFTSTDNPNENPAYVILPAQPRDDVFGPAGAAPVAVAALEPAVVGWHAAARWDELEQVIRRTAGRRESSVVSLWRGEVLRSAGKQRRHECWYLVVLIGSPLRPAENGVPSASVCSLEFAVPAAFLTAVDDALDLFEQETGPNRPIPVAAPKSVGPCPGVD